MSSLWAVGLQEAVTVVVPDNPPISARTTHGCKEPISPLSASSKSVASSKGSALIPGQVLPSSGLWSLGYPTRGGDPPPVQSEEEEVRAWWGSRWAKLEPGLGRGAAGRRGLRLNLAEVLATLLEPRRIGALRRPCLRL